jgi:hypothetical protein
MRLLGEQHSMSTRRTIVLAGSALVLVTIALAARHWTESEPRIVVIRDPAGQRATMLLNAADTAIAHGRPEIARVALASAYDQPTASPEIAIRVARLADRLHEESTAALAYRRYLSVAPGSPAADTVRTRLLALVREPMASRAVGAAPVADLRHVAETTESAGETDRVVEATAAPHRRPVRRTTLRTAAAR